MSPPHFLAHHSGELARTRAGSIAAFGKLRHHPASREFGRVLSELIGASGARGALERGPGRPFGATHSPRFLCGLRAASTRRAWPARASTHGAQPLSDDETLEGARAA